jgi:hypothetical protein
MLTDVCELSVLVLSNLKTKSNLVSLVLTIRMLIEMIAPPWQSNCQSLPGSVSSPLPTSSGPGVVGERLLESGDVASLDEEGVVELSDEALLDASDDWLLASDEPDGVVAELDASDELSELADEASDESDGDVAELDASDEASELADEASDDESELGDVASEDAPELAPSLEAAELPDGVVASLLGAIEDGLSLLITVTVISI